jgi:branched-chain amino acid transport system substrate-binding protein
VVARIRGVAAESIAAGDGGVWVAEVGDRIAEIDPRTNAVARKIDVDSESPDAALPASSCSGVFYGREGKPDVLLVSDLPLRGQSADYTRAMVEGIRFALERRGFEAGRYSVGYQSCDPSTAQGGVADEYRCMLNAKDYARNLDVIGVIGAWNSYCTYLQLPFANEAPEGPLGMISPANTGTPLTRPYPGWPQSEVDALYPTGERNYVRIVAANHLQAVAMMQLAQELGANRVFLLGDNEWDGMPADARKAAQNLGLRVAGEAPWNYEAQDFDGLARRIARSRPDAVAIFGLYEQNEGALISDLRDALGPDVPLIAGDGFMPFEGLVKAAGPAAEGMYLALYGLPDSELPPTGKRFLEEFEAAHGGQKPPWYMATYGAQAVEILLDAIARSDGTRASVNTELRGTTVEDGILGDIDFDENGDLVEGPVTFFRAVGPREPSATEVVGSKGLAFDRVIMARAELLD